MDNSDALERLQRRFLDALYRQSSPGEIVLKGGLALRAVYGQHRRTADIDLDQDPRRSLGHLQKIIRKAIHTTIRGSEFIALEISEPKQTETVARWKLSGKLADGSPLHITIEVSRRHEINKDNLHTIYLRDIALPGLGTPGKIDTYTVTILARHKVMALLNPKRHAPRDLYDLLRLLENPEVCNPLQGLDTNELHSMQSELREKIDSFSWPEFQDQVVVLMDVSEAENFNQELFEQMQHTVGEGISTWLEQAELESGKGDSHE